MVPTWTGKNLGRAFSRQGNLLRLEKSGNFTQNTGKIKKKLHWKISKNTGKVREICWPVIAKTLQIWYHTLNIKTCRKL